MQGCEVRAKWTLIPASLHEFQPKKGNNSRMGNHWGKRNQRHWHLGMATPAPATAAAAAANGAFQPSATAATDGAFQPQQKGHSNTTSSRWGVPTPAAAADGAREVAAAGAPPPSSSCKRGQSNLSSSSSSNGWGVPP